MSENQSLKQLKEIKSLLKTHRETNKAWFGLLFWELQEAAKHYTFEAICQQQASLSLSSEDDEQYASLLSTYLQLWDSAKDFNAASRFIADCLEMTADELIECKILFEKSEKEG